jgi:hypothetical protein
MAPAGRLCLGRLDEQVGAQITERRVDGIESPNARALDLSLGNLRNRRMPNAGGRGQPGEHPPDLQRLGEPCDELFHFRSSARSCSKKNRQRKANLFLLEKQFERGRELFQKEHEGAA